MIDNNHVKPTTEELLAEQETLLKDIEDQQNEPPEKPEVEPVVPPVEPPAEPPEKPEKPEVEPVVPPVEPPKEEFKEIEVEEEDADGNKIKVLKKVKVEPVVPPVEPVKLTPEQIQTKRYRESTRESQVLHRKNEVLNDAFKKVKNVPEPTQEDMDKLYPTWEDMSEFEQKMAKKDWRNDRRFEAIDEIAVNAESAEAWGKKVSEFVDDPQTLIDNPKLEGKVSDFKKFASVQSRVSVAFPDLVNLFLFDVSTNKPAPKKGGMFESGGAGGDSKKVTPKSNKLSVEAGAQLKNRDYKEYKKKLLAGEIESGI